MVPNHIIISTQSILYQGKATLYDVMNYIVSEAGENIDGFEVTFFQQYVLEEHDLFRRSILELIRRFPVNCIHIFQSEKERLGNNSYMEKLVDALDYYIERADGVIKGIVFHPDTLESLDYCQRLTWPNVYLGLEVLGRDAAGGNTLGDVEMALTRNPSLSLVLDLAHIYEMEPFGEPSGYEYWKRFHSRVKEIHFSYPANLYDPQAMEAGFTTPHSLVSLKSDDFEEIYPGIRDMRGVIFNIEGVIPFGKYGLEMLEREIRLLRQLFPETFRQRL